MGMMTFARRCRHWLFAELLEAQRQTIAHPTESDHAAFYHLPNCTLSFGYRGSGYSFYLPDGDHDVLQSDMVAQRTFYEEPLLRAVRDKVEMRGRVVIDAGANIGSHSVYFALVCGAARVIAFEPNNFAADILQKNVELNHVSSVIDVRRTALSDATGTMSFDIQDPHNLGSTSFKSGGPDGIPSIAIDDLHLPAIALLKCDVEGAAYAVVRGAVRTIGRLHPSIMIELFDEEFAETNALIKSIGYPDPELLAPNNYLYVPRDADRVD